MLSCICKDSMMGVFMKLSSFVGQHNMLPGSYQNKSMGRMFLTWKCLKKGLPERFDICSYITASLCI